MAEAFSYKITTETQPCTFDFSQVLSSGETISSVVFTVLVQQGVDASPSAILSGTATISNFKVTQKITGGLTNVTYRLVATITTSLSNTYVGVGDITIYEASEV